MWGGHFCVQLWWQTGAEGNLYELDKNSETVYQIKGGVANPLPLLLSGLPFFSHWITTFRPRQSDTLGSNVSLATVLAGSVVCVWASPAAYRRRNAADASTRRRSVVKGTVLSLFTNCFWTVIIHPSIQAQCRHSRFIILGEVFPNCSTSACIGVSLFQKKEKKKKNNPCPLQKKNPNSIKWPRCRSCSQKTGTVTQQQAQSYPS